MIREAHTNAPLLWEWAVEAYELKGVADTLLRMQDEDGLNINAILWSIWAGQNFSNMTSAQLSRVFDGNHWWQQEVVAPLRSIRRKMKSSKQANSEYNGQVFRQQVKQLELLAEKNELSALCHKTRKHVTPHAQSTIEAQEYGLENFKHYYQFCREVESHDKVKNHEPDENIIDRFLSVQLIILQEAI